jgi:serine/threonine protein phosphatase PrpC
MGTTAVVALKQADQVYVAGLGDSRAYLIRDGRAEQVTADHSWVAEQVRAGLLPPEAAIRDARRNMLTRALTGEPVQADGFDLDVRPGDVIVLCSDGAWDILGGDGIAERFAPSLALLEAVETAVDDAITGGSTDNVTVVACRVLARAPRPAEETAEFPPAQEASA